MPKKLPGNGERFQPAMLNLAAVNPDKKPVAKKKIPAEQTALLKRATAVKKPAARKPVAKKKKSGGVPTTWKFIIAAALLILFSPFYYGYVIKLFSSTWRWITDIGETPNYRTYKSFNIKIPEKYSIHGIDVSCYQGKIDWQKVKSMNEDGVHISFAFIKATEGILSVDPYFQRNWREAPKAGIICGAYHYLNPKKSGLWQAKFFLQTVKIEKHDLPMVVDIETLNNVAPAKMREELTSFVKHVRDKTGVKPIIYTSITFYQDYLAGYFDDYTLWIAHYQQPRLKLDTNTKWRFWQHSDRAKVSGINHAVDFDAFRGDSLAFERLLVH